MLNQVAIQYCSRHRLTCILALQIRACFTRLGFALWRNEDLCCAVPGIHRQDQASSDRHQMTALRHDPQFSGCLPEPRA